jgi:hypothetical protein
VQSQKNPGVFTLKVPQLLRIFHCGVSGPPGCAPYHNGDTPMNDLGKAFSFPFKDRAWFTKFLIGSLFMLLSIVLVGIFILAGYFVRVTQAAMRKDEQALPEWEDIGGMLVTGFKFVIVYIVYSIPLVLLYIPLIVMAVMGELAGQGDVSGIFAGLYAAGISILVIPYALALSLFMPIIAYRFAANERIGEALDVGEIFRAFRSKWQESLIVALIAVGIQSFAAVGLILFLVGVFFTIFYSYVVSAHMFGRLAPQVQETGGIRTA